MTYSDYVLDSLTATKLTSLTACDGAVEVRPLPPAYEHVIRLKWAISGAGIAKDNDRVLILTFISHLRTAISEYDHGRHFLQEYVEALPERHLLDAHRQALAHFESSILQLHVALVSNAALSGGTKPGKAKPGQTQLYICEDGSPYDQVRLLANSIKHFDEYVESAAERNAPVPIAALWITNDGFDCIKEAQLSFAEMAELFEDQAQYAEQFSNL